MLGAGLALVFLSALGAGVVAEGLPPAIAALYAGASLLAFIVYARDKAAARNHQWRTSEGMLHLLGLAGGWPGALLAQQVLRHKSRKAAFRALSVATALLHCAALAWLYSDQAVALVRVAGI